MNIKLSLPPTTNSSKEYAEHIICRVKQVDLALLPQGTSNEALSISTIVPLGTQVFSKPKMEYKGQQEIKENQLYSTGAQLNTSIHPTGILSQSNTLFL